MTSKQKIDPEEIPKFNKIREGIQGIADLEAVITNLVENNDNSMRKGEELPRPYVKEDEGTPTKADKNQGFKQ